MRALWTMQANGLSPIPAPGAPPPERRLPAARGAAGPKELQLSLLVHCRYSLLTMLLTTQLKDWGEQTVDSIQYTVERRRAENSLITDGAEVDPRSSPSRRRSCGLPSTCLHGTPSCLPICSSGFLRSGSACSVIGCCFLAGCLRRPMSSRVVIVAQARGSSARELWQGE